MEIIIVSLVFVIAVGVGFWWVIGGIVVFILGGLLAGALIVGGTLPDWASAKLDRQMVDNDLKRTLG